MILREQEEGYLKVGDLEKDILRGDLDKDAID